MRMWKIVLGNKGNTRSNGIIKGTIVILILSLVVTIVMTRRVMMTNEKIYITTLQHNLVHINDSKIYLEQIINDYENLANYELELNSIAEQFTSIEEILPIINNNDKSKIIFSDNENDEYFNSFVEVFRKYAQIVRDWSVNIDAEEVHGYPSIDDLKGLLNDLNQYYDLFCLEERENEYYVGDIHLKDFNYSYVSKAITKVINNSYFDEIKKLY
ncbi:hypothetical protein [Clostridium sp. UBA4395]|uniref:hypothetical protein n=1 Tax=Clostridium sp. UBA4395 TaxID=1946360 RepID=UPI003217AC15